MSFLYQFVKYSGRIGIPFFFGHLEINGRENIPDNLPYLIAPNHQNAFLDAILMGVYSRQPMHFLTRSDVFVPPFIGALTALNMMPIYRIRDGYEQLSKNEAVFSTCEQHLRNHEPVLIFPEGNMDRRHYLRPLTKGTARLAFQTQMNLSEDLLILPVGINYFDHYRPRHKCIINYGEPLRVREYLEEYNQHAAKGLISLRNDLSHAMKELLLIPEKEDYDDKVTALNYKNEKLSFPELRHQIKQSSFTRANYIMQLKWLPKVLVLFNPLAILVVHWILKTKIKHPLFTSSIKYTLGLVLSVLWWIILFMVTFILWDATIAFSCTLFSVLALFVRSELLKRSTPPTI